MEAPQSANQKVAIVGIGCRYGNGVDSVKQFWEMLTEGLDCTTPIPRDRFDASYFLSPGDKAAGKLYTQNGGYISQDPYMFDRQFFKMPPDEAAHLDPQVRLLLEVTWEALENAGIPASALRGSQTGVYMGVTAQEYNSFTSTPYHNMNQYSNSGTNSCMVSNRISYEFDLRGPSFSVDTACSSSLYSVYLACEALKRNSCSTALAGGVNLILMPTATIGFCQAGMLAGDGKCKSFDQSADGYSRSEGAGVVVLKLLSDALKDGDRIYAVIRGGTLSNDGRTPGIANPSYEAQVHLVKSACRNARVHPSEIVYAEAHGTGTKVGDKTEAGALGEVMGSHRGPQDPPLYIGSVKSNLGHTEGAAGVAGIIKVALSLHQGRIPRVVHFEAPNDNLDLKALQINIPKTLTNWPKEDRRNLACCSSFGFGGANANLVLERSNGVSNGIKSSIDKKDTLACLLVSAANQEALYQRVQEWKKCFIEDSDNGNKLVYNASLYTAAVRSHHHAYRIGFIVRSREDALEQLQHKLDNVPQDKARYVEGIASATSDTKQQIVFVFSGMGTQWWGMARELMRTQPVFASKIKIIDEILRKCGTKWSLVAMLTKETSKELINKTEISQPCLCAVAIGLVDLWRQRGLVPNAVVGHSVGEVAAAYAAGLLSLEQAVKLIYRRGRELQKTSGSGKMVAVLHRVEDTLQLAKNNKYGKLLDVAAVNSPTQVVFSGDSSSVEGFVNDLKSDNVKCVVLKVNNAFHSRQQDVVKNPFIHKVGKFLNTEKVVGKTKTLPMMSTVTGRYLTDEEANSPAYWFQNVRRQVSFMEATKKLAKDGYRVFVEVGPHPSLLPALRGTFTEFQDADGKFISTGSLVRPRDTSKIAADSENLLMSQMKLHVSGIKVDFRHLFQPAYRRVVSIPHYPWQREKCSSMTQEAIKNFLFPIEEGKHVLLGEQSQTFYLKESPVKIWRANLNASRVPWVKDHVLQGAVVVPAAAYTETALAAARSLFTKRYPMVLSGLSFDRFMFAPDCEGCLETTVEEKTSDEYLFTLRSHEESTKKWTQHCHLNITRPVDYGNAQQSSAAKVDVERISKRCTKARPTEDFYGLARECGFQLGPTFRGMVAFTYSEDCKEALVTAEAPPSVQREFHRFVYHPAFMDSILQSFAVLMLLTGQEKQGMSAESSRSIYRVPKSITRFVLHSETPPRVIIHMRVKHTNQQFFCDIDVADSETKNVFCSVKELVFETIQAEKIQHQVWSTSWKNLGTLDVSSTQSTAAFQKRIVMFSDGTDTSLSLIRLLKDDGVDLAVIEGNTDITEKVLEVLSKYQDTDTIFILMRTSEALGIDLNTKSVMSQNQFEKLQEDGPLACCAVFNGVRQMAGRMQLQLLLITKGGYKTNEGDDIQPFAAVNQAVPMILAHEENNLSGSLIDLPITRESEDCAKIAWEILRREDAFLRDENCLAVRNLTSRGTSFDILTPRIQMDSISESPGIVPATCWSLDAQASSGSIFVGNTPLKATDEVDEESFPVKVEAFLFYTSSSDVTSKHASFLCTYAGKPGKESDLAQNSSTFIGVTTCQTISSVMAAKFSNLTEVPSYLTSSEAVSIVRDFLPYAVLFDQAIPVSSGMRFGFKVDVIDGSVLAAEQLARSSGAETVILKEGDEGRDTKNSSTTVRGSNSVDESSIDILFLCTSSSTLDRSLKSLLPKLKRNATVVIIEGTHQRNHTHLPTLPPKMKMMMFDPKVQAVVESLTTEDMSLALSDLWKMFDPITEGHLSCNLENFKDFSSLAASNTPIPEEEIIEVSENEVLLPLSLEQDGFIADKEYAYFITGGTSGFGLKLLEWLVARGARYIHIGSRRPMNDEIQKVIQQAATVGANVQHIQMDISNATDVERELKKMQRGSDNWPTLKCIFHCAAVFNDGFLYNLTTESWNSVMAPKAYGALLLHQVTEKLGIKLDRFLMISSIVSLIGNAGQASYCSANVFLNALSHYRHTRGLPATAIQAGVISNVGFAVRKDLLRMWQTNGVDSMTPNDVLGAIGCALKANVPQLGISGYFNRNLYAKRHRGLMLKHFTEKQGTVSMMRSIFHDRDVYLAAAENTLRQVILKLPVPKAREKVMEKLAEFLSEQLGLTDPVQYDSSPISLGLDSLKASEFSQQVNQQFEVNLGALDFLNDKNTIEELGKTITKSIFAKEADARDESVESDNRDSSTPKVVVVEGEAPSSVAVKLVCFPSNGAGPSLYASWIGHLIRYGIQVLMIQLPGWEGRDDEQPLNNLSEITRLIRDNLVTKLNGSPFVFFGHSMGSLIAFEVAHLLVAEDRLSPKHLFISSWYAPTVPYPHPEELNISHRAFDRIKELLQSNPQMLRKVLKEEKVKFSFLDNTTLSNLPLMRRLVPCIEAASSMCKSYPTNPRKPMKCGLTVFGGKEDTFVSPGLLDGWEMQRTREFRFKKVLLQGNHMYILTRSAEVLKELCNVCTSIIKR
ncbi:phthiocerol/phenolphthiocerol synthesis polyketide synthase type I PpsD-like [Asterias rubens]|uniref:phthiocerol/phenolphthiocerol synthesis polyketide synthase type I PpsD-like n=1 Tax=Asterias rubens TaxID=7604 RepID=UPI001455B106|nr:phthiocerol/phenolphthiocerol synthesis polyketide synthase type I PpsD-like [Asterias rubens]